MPEGDVFLAPAFQTHEFDEVAVFNQALADADILSIFGASTRGPADDPQDTALWEEVYGADYPFTAETMPSISNGLCRVTFDTTRKAWKVYAHVDGSALSTRPGAGYMEMGRVTVWLKGSTGSYQRMGVIQGVTLYEWTPERGVIRMVLDTYDAGSAFRAELLVTVQRGWSGPRFEVYPSPFGGETLSCYIRWSPFRDDAFMVGDAIGTSRTTDEGATWDDQTLIADFTAVGQANWIAYMNGQKQTVLSTLRSGYRVKTYDDTGAYGSTRKAVAIGADYGAAASGYATVKIDFAPGRDESEILGTITEAETYIQTGAGTRSLVTDAGAEGAATDNAIEETQAAQTNSTLIIPAAALAKTPIGIYSVLARIRVVDAGATVSAQAQIAGTGANAGTVVATSTSTSFEWKYLGTVTHNNDDNTLAVNIWRSAGTGNTRIDRIALVLRTNTEALTGASDFGRSHLIDTRSIPELVTR